MADEWESTWAPLPGEQVTVGADPGEVGQREYDTHELGERAAAGLAAADSPWDDMEND